MAHRTDVVQVHRNFPTQGPSEALLDPFCGQKMERKVAKSVLFRADGEALYFCSKDCREKFLASDGKQVVGDEESKEPGRAA